MEVDRKEVLAAVRTVSKGVASRPGIPALTGVKVTADPGLHMAGGKLTFEGTDLEIAVSVTVDVAPFAHAWEALVPLKPLAAALKVGPERVTFEPEAAIGPADGIAGANTPAFRAGQSTLRCLPLEDFPTLADLPSMVDVPLEGYVRAASTAYAATSRDESRPILTGVLHAFSVIDKPTADSPGSLLTLVGTDSYRLHVAQCAYGGPSGKVVVPRDAVKVVLGIAGKKTAGRVLWIGFGENEVAWRVDNVTVMSRLIEGEFPNYAQLMPDLANDYGKATFEPGPMLEAIETVGAICRDTNPIRINLNGSVEISASTDLGNASVTVDGATWTGEALTIALNPIYLADALKATGASVLYTRDGLKPSLAVGPNGTALVMPVRLPAVV